MNKLLFIIPLCFLTVYAKNEELEGHTLYQVKVQTLEQVDLLKQLEEKYYLDVWNYAVPGREGIVLIPRDLRHVFQRELYEAGITYKVAVQNIKESVDLEDEMLAEAASARTNRSHPGLPFDRIHRFAVVDNYMVELARLYPNVVRVVSGGTSVQGRDIKYLRISTTDFQDTRKPVILMMSLLHSREWVTLPATLYAIEKLVIDVTEQDLVRDIDWIILPIANPDGYEFSHTNDRRKPVVMLMSLLHAREWITLPATLYAIEKLVIDVTDPDLVNDVDWIILPIANPDGYEFSHTNTRFWRKNRAPGLICMGVDPNRNFDFLWGTASSNNPCSEIFHGRGPFSEPETQVVRDIILEHRGRLEMFLDIHSFGSMILYGFGNRQLPPNALTLNFVAVNMAQRIDAVKWPQNRNFIVGNSAAIFSRDSGASTCWSLTVDVPLSYTYELPSYRNNVNNINGFLVNPAFILQAGFETWEGIKDGARWVVQNTRMKQMKRRR